MTVSFFRRIVVLVGLIVTFYLVGIECSPYVISNERVRSLDVNPVLGRGYSVMTNSFQSTCLMIDQTTVPSYNYEFELHDFTQVSNENTFLTSSFARTLSYWWLRSRYEDNLESASQSNTKTRTHKVVATMRIERYYASVREEITPLSNDASTLLDDQDFIGFFKACGSNYVRGIRRSQEVIAIFEFKARSLSLAQNYASSLIADNSGGGWRGKKSNNDKRSTDQVKFVSIQNSLSIIIKGYGLGLNHGGRDTLVASSLEDFNNIMKLAFRLMTQNKDSHHIGMVSSVEVIPWVDSLAFQAAARMEDMNIVVPLPRSLIPRAFPKDQNGTSVVFANDDSTRLLFECKDLSFQIDKYGYCCGSEALYNYYKDEYDNDNPQTRICKPIRTLDKSVAKNNIASNGEFVARLDQLIRIKLNQHATLERCIYEAVSLPEKYDYHTLEPQIALQPGDETFENEFTLIELRGALDPFYDLSLVNHLTKEVAEFMDMFYRPCLAALFGSNIGTDSDTDPTFFAAYAWHTHDECSKMSCFGNNMRWDRHNGGCVPGLLTGSSAAAYNDNEDSKCSYADKGGLTQECKYKQSDLQAFQVRATQTWDNTVGDLSIGETMSHFCMPRLTGEMVDFETRVEIGERFGLDVTNSPSMAPSVAPSVTSPPSISTAPSTAQQVDGVFSLQSLQNDADFCLDWNAFLAPNYPLIVGACHTVPELWQKWSQDLIGRIYSLHNIDKCIDMGTGTVVPGSPVFMSTCNDSQSQLWVIDQEGRMRNKLHNLYFGVQGSCDDPIPEQTDVEAQAYQDSPCNKMQQWFVKR